MTINQKISLALLIGRMITVTFVGMTARLQWRLIKQNDGPELQVYRVILFSLTLILIFGNIIPIVIDVASLFNKGSLTLLVAYVFSNNITAMLAAVILWYLYHRTGKGKGGQ